MEIINKQEGRTIILSKDEICFTKRVLYASERYWNDSLEPFAVDVKNINFEKLTMEYEGDFIMIFNLKNKKQVVITVNQGKNYLFQIGDQILNWSQFYTKADKAGRKMKQLLGVN